MDRFKPPPETDAQRAKHAREMKHFKFAFILIMGVMLALPILGAIVVWMGFFEMPK